MSDTYPTVILTNRKTGRYHPMPFKLFPLPSSDPNDAIQRHRSIGHHAPGFDTLEEAEKHIDENDLMRRESGYDMEWDGENSPHCNLFLEVK